MRQFKTNLTMNEKRRIAKYLGIEIKPVQKQQGLTPAEAKRVARHLLAGYTVEYLAAKMNRKRKTLLAQMSKQGYSVRALKKDAKRLKAPILK